jgi:hypothetical protein
LDFLDFASTLGAGMADRFFVHEANVSSRLVVQVILVVAAALLDGLADGLEDGLVQFPLLTFVQVIYRGCRGCNPAWNRMS